MSKNVTNRYSLVKLKLTAIPIDTLEPCRTNIFFDVVSEEEREKKWSSVKRVGLDEMSTGDRQKKYSGMVNDLEKKKANRISKGSNTRSTNKVPNAAFKGD